MTIDLERTARVTVRVSPREREHLEGVAARHGVGVSAIVRAALGFDDGEVRLREGDLAQRGEPPEAV